MQDCNKENRDLLQTARTILSKLKGRAEGRLMQGGQDDEVEMEVADNYAADTDRKLLPGSDEVDPIQIALNERDQEIEQDKLLRKSQLERDAAALNPTAKTKMAKTRETNAG